MPEKLIGKDTESVRSSIKWFERIQYVGLFFLSLILIAGIDIITADIGWGFITDPYFYISNVITDIALVLITYGVVYLYLDWYKENNKLYIEAKKTVDDFAMSDRNVPTIVGRFLTVINRKRKIIQYKFNIRLKLYMLENRKRVAAYLPIIKHFIKNKYRYSEEEMHIWYSGTPEEKEKSAYCRKRKMYEEQLNESLIEKIIDNEFVRYDKITTDVLLSEYYDNSSKQTTNDFVTKNEQGQIARYRIPKLILSFGFMLLISSLVLDNYQFNLMSLITISSKLLTIAANSYTSYRYAKKHAVSITLHDMLFRRSIIIEYDKWLTEEAEKATIEEEKKNIVEAVQEPESQAIEYEEPIKEITHGTEPTI